MRLLRLLPLFCLLFAAAHAQSVQWQTGESGDPSDLQLVFDDCAPEGDPQLPSLADASISFVGSSQQTSIVNFKMSRSVVLTYRLRPRGAGKVTLPAFSVKTDKGDLRVAAFTSGAVKAAPEVNIHGRLLPGVTSVWAGEVFPLNYTIDVGRRIFNQLGSAIDWNAAPLVAEDWSKPEPTEFTSNGEARLNIAYKTRAYAKSPGTLAINPTTQLVNLAVGTVGFGLFQQQRIEQVSVTSNQPSISVRPLPSAPAGFTGAVGQFRLNSKVVPTTTAVGEPITWTLELDGTGNWPDLAGLPAREVSKDFQVIQPEAKRTPAEGKLFDSTLAEDVVLVPTKPGTYTLAPVAFTYFDPKTGTYQTLTTPRTTVTVTVPNAPKFNVTPPADETTPAAVTAGKAPQAPTPPALPAAIPRDPL
ncbi:MAG: BatD family protein, partial [Opitutaceae bacterium]|nr:BatD family protein [Opitutaceae bacterium]